MEGCVHHLLSTLTLISQDLAVCSRLGFGLLVEKGLAPSLMKVMASSSPCRLASSCISPTLVCQQETEAPYHGATYIVLELEMLYTHTELAVWVLSQPPYVQM